MKPLKVHHIYVSIPMPGFTTYYIDHRDIVVAEFTEGRGWATELWKYVLTIGSNKVWLTEDIHKKAQCNYILNVRFEPNINNIQETIDRIKKLSVLM